MFSCADGSVRRRQLRQKDSNEPIATFVMVQQCWHVFGCNGHWLCSDGESVVPCRVTQAEHRKPSEKISANFNLADQVVPWSFSFL